MAIENRLVTFGVSPQGGNGASTPRSLSGADGRFVLFSSNAFDLVDGIVDTNANSDVFLFDRVTEARTLVSRSGSSVTTTANARSVARAISADGEWVLFESMATDLIVGGIDVNDDWDVFLYQRSTGLVSLLSRSFTAVARTGNKASRAIEISANGEWVLFESEATDLVSNVMDGNSSQDAFLFQRSTGAISVLSRSASAPSITANRSSVPVSLSADGEWVLLQSSASNLVSGVVDNNSADDVFLYRRSTGAVSLITRSVGSPNVVANGGSAGIAMTPDGEWVLIQSRATDLVAGTLDVNGAREDVFMYQRSSGAMLTVSRSASAASTSTGNDQSVATAISADGEWVLFQSVATNLVSGVSDSNNSWDVFLYARDTGAVRLISRAASPPLTTANQGSLPTSISADGEWVLFQSNATDLVQGVVDGNSAPDAMLYQRSTGTISLVSRSATLATRTANGPSVPIGMSSDGLWVVLSSHATDFVDGFADGNGASNPDAFLFRRDTAKVTLASHSAETVLRTANDQSLVRGFSADGEWVIFNSDSSNLLGGARDTNGGSDAFMYRRSSGDLTLVSRSASSATTTGNGLSGTGAISGDGEWVLFGSNATDLVNGVSDTNNQPDVFLFQRSTGEVSLVSRSFGSDTTAANGFSNPIGISADGEWVFFQSQATNLVAGVSDTNNEWDVFLYQRSSGLVRLVSRSATSASSSASGGSRGSHMSADGEWLVFLSYAPNIVPGVADSNGTWDVFIYQRSTGSVLLASRAGTSATNSANGQSFPYAFSPDGEWLLLVSLATNLVGGMSDSNADWDAFLFQRSSGSMRLVSRSTGSATTTGNRRSHPADLSADGKWIVFRSVATDLVAGVADTNEAEDVFLYERDTGLVSLISRSADLPATTANSASFGSSISSDGEWISLFSRATDLVANVSDINNSYDSFLYRRSTSAMNLVSRSATMPMTTANGESTSTLFLGNAEWLLLQSRASDLVSGVLDSNGREDIFLASMGLLRDQFETAPNRSDAPASHR